MHRDEQIYQLVVSADGVQAWLAAPAGGILIRSLTRLLGAHGEVKKSCWMSRMAHQAPQLRRLPSAELQM